MDDAIFATLSDQVSQQTEVIIYMHDNAILPGNYSSNDAILQPSHQMTCMNMIVFDKIGLTKCTVINVFLFLLMRKKDLRRGYRTQPLDP